MQIVSFKLEYGLWERFERYCKTYPGREKSAVLRKALVEYLNRAEFPADPGSSTQEKDSGAPAPAGELPAGSAVAARLEAFRAELHGELPADQGGAELPVLPARRQSGQKRSSTRTPGRTAGAGADCVTTAGGDACSTAGGGQAKERASTKAGRKDTARSTQQPPKSNGRAEPKRKEKRK